MESKLILENLENFLRNRGEHKERRPSGDDFLFHYLITLPWTLPGWVYLFGRVEVTLHLAHLPLHDQRHVKIFHPWSIERALLIVHEVSLPNIPAIKTDHLYSASKSEARSSWF